MFGIELNPLQIWLGLPCASVMAAMLIWIIVGELIDDTRQLREWLAEREEMRRGFEVEVKPTSGLSPEQREREAHHG